MLSGMTHSGADAKSDRGHLVSRKRNTEGQTEEQQSGKLNQSRTATCEGGKKVCDERNEKENGLFQHGLGPVRLCAQHCA